MYDALFAEYRTLHDYFSGRPEWAGNAVLHRLRDRRNASDPRMSALDDRSSRTLREQVSALHAELVRYGLVVWTAGQRLGAAYPAMT